VSSVKPRGPSGRVLEECDQGQGGQAVAADIRSAAKEITDDSLGKKQASMLQGQGFAACLKESGDGSHSTMKAALGS